MPKHPSDILRFDLVEDHGFVGIPQVARLDPNVTGMLLAMAFGASSIVGKLGVLEGIGIILRWRWSAGNGKLSRLEIMVIVVMVR